MYCLYVPSNIIISAINNADIPYNIKKIFINKYNNSSDVPLWLKDVYINNDQVLSYHVDRIMEQYNENLFHHIIYITSKNYPDCEFAIELLQEYMVAFLQEDEFIKNFIPAIDKAIFKIDEKISDLEYDLENKFFDEHNEDELTRLIDKYDTQLDYLSNLLVYIKDISNTSIEVNHNENYKTQLSCL